MEVEPKAEAETEQEEIWMECNSMKEQGSDYKAVRYHALKMYTCIRHGDGVLHCFD
jgi:hypothetical protein